MPHAFSAVVASHFFGKLLRVRVYVVGVYLAHLETGYILAYSSELFVVVRVNAISKESVFCRLLIKNYRRPLFWTKLPSWFIRPS